MKNNQKNNAFDNVFSAVKKDKEETVDMSTIQHVNMSTVNKKDSKKKTKEKVNMLTSKHVNSSTVVKKTDQKGKKDDIKNKRILQSGRKTKSKTFFLSEDIIKMLGYLKFKEGIKESEYANEIFEKFFEKNFGKDWKNIIS